MFKFLLRHWWKIGILLFLFLPIVFLLLLLLKDNPFLDDTSFESGSTKSEICQNNDIEYALREYLDYVSSNYLENGKSIDDPVEKYKDSSIDYENGEIKEMYLSFAPSRFPNLIYATALSEQYLGLDMNISSSLLERYIQITSPYESEGGNSEDIKYVSQNIFSICHPLKYQERLPQDTKEIVIKICKETYYNLDIENTCNELNITKEQLESSIDAFLSENIDILVNLKLDQQIPEDYQLGDKSVDYFLLSNLSTENVQKQNCLERVGYKSLGSAMYILLRDYKTNGVYSTDGVIQLLATLSYLEEKEILGEDNKQMSQLISFLLNEALGNSVYYNEHDSNLMSPFALETKKSGYHIRFFKKEKELVRDEISLRHLFSEYCESRNLPFLLFEKSENATYGSLDATSRLILDLILFNY